MRLLRWEVESWITCWVSRRSGAGGDVPEGSHLGLAGVFIDNLTAHAGAFVILAVVYCLLIGD